MQRISDKVFNGHWIYLDDSNTPILLPSLYARYTTHKGVSIELKSKFDRILSKTEHCFEEVEIGTNGQYVRSNQIGLFLEWVEEQNISGSQLSLTNHTAMPSELINSYINDYLICSQGKSEVVVNRAVYSLRSYYNWLHYFFGNAYKNIFIFSSHRELARSNNKENLLVKYLLPATRELLYRRAATLLEEVVLRNGGELGCRASENRGFLLEDFITNKNKHSGLLTLFSQLEKKTEKDEFEYHLSSIYTKNGRSRTLYIPRILLIKMKRYYDTERPESDSNHLFVSNSNNGSKGNCISSRFPSDTFHAILNEMIKDMKDKPYMYRGFQTLEKGAVYHHLLHSFGTDIFYEECRKRGKIYDSITTESAVYIETARLMGHKVDAKYGNQTTKTYIHSCGHIDSLLKATNEG
ncbi:hypothetical protein [Vibrio tapetis]|uniref:Uncharacterized protein n=1 Tax=Vibrio tapetis subsp. tapetis TaxID=1671868 RepID=A0A2N8ZE80_9VIBR|nr:hypothetical protein [Vibrio tapetis]SON50217.1 conserved protein of unknown function [Vibrio tapetis subsp. tapetis]